MRNELKRAQRALRLFHAVSARHSHIHPIRFHGGRVQLMYWPQGFLDRPEANIRVVRPSGEVLAQIDVAGDGYHIAVDTFVDGGWYTRLMRELKTARREHIGFTPFAAVR